MEVWSKLISFVKGTNITTTIDNNLEPTGKTYKLILDGEKPDIPYSTVERLCKMLIPEDKSDYESCYGEVTIFGPLVGDIGYQSDGSYRSFSKYQIETDSSSITLEMKSR